MFSMRDLGEYARLARDDSRCAVSSGHEAAPRVLTFSRNNTIRSISEQTRLQECLLPRMGVVHDTGCDPGKWPGESLSQTNPKVFA